MMLSKDPHLSKKLSDSNAQINPKDNSLNLKAILLFYLKNREMISHFLYFLSLIIIFHNVG
jgi:hypothetical protein